VTLGCHTDFLRFRFLSHRFENGWLKSGNWEPGPDGTGFFCPVFRPSVGHDIQFELLMWKSGIKLGRGERGDGD
jgi:hypothetical protein